MGYVDQLLETSGISGVYSAAFKTGVVAAGTTAGAEHLHFRWQPLNSSVCIVLSVVVTVAPNTSFGTPTLQNSFALFRASAWSAQGSDGTAITLGTDCRLDTSYRASQISIGDIRVNSTLEPGLNAGTKTLETHPLGRANWHATTAQSPQQHLSLYDISRARQPIRLRGPTAATAEGLVLNQPDKVGTGTFVATVQIIWAETLPV